MGPANLLYPVVSRRSGGLSLGVELFPGGKRCNFDCPYCEVFPFRSDAEFDPDRLDAELDAWLGRHPNPGARDLCLSGSGEPTLSPALGAALDRCARALRDRRELEGARLVLITNSSRLGDPSVAALLGEYRAAAGLEIWAKLDASSEAGFAAMGGRDGFAATVDGLRSFASRVPVVLQAMFCALDGAVPGGREASAWAAFVLGLADSGARFERVDLYTQARPAPSRRTAPLSNEAMAGIGAVVRAVACGPLGLPLRAFGSSGPVIERPDAGV